LMKTQERKNGMQDVVQNYIHMNHKLWCIWQFITLHFTSIAYIYILMTYLAIHYDTSHMYHLLLYTYDVFGNSLRFIPHALFIFIYVWCIWQFITLHSTCIVYIYLLMMYLAIHYASFHMYRFTCIVYIYTLINH
jgi:hypothetical protein